VRESYQSVKGPLDEQLKVLCVFAITAHTSKPKRQNQHDGQNVQELIDPNRFNYLIARFKGINHEVSTEQDSSSKY